MAEHLLVELFTEPGKRGCHRLSVGIFGLQVCRYLGVFFVTQPGVVILQDDAVLGELLFDALVSSEGCAQPLPASSSTL